MSVLSASRLRGALVSVALLALMSLGFTGSASAGGTKGPSTFNNATVNISGGNAAALAACVNVAKHSAKHGKVVQNNFCKNVATAQGGNVTLRNVRIKITQLGSGDGTTRNNATVNISGGDATAIAACVNYMNGSATAYQTNVCANKASAKGGNVTLRNVRITILQA